MCDGNSCVIRVHRICIYQHPSTTLTESYDYIWHRDTHRERESESESVCLYRFSHFVYFNKIKIGYNKNTLLPTQMVSERTNE